MAVAAADVKKLRDSTGAGMMDAKRALEEAEGDFDKATEILRVKYAAKVQKRGAERTASAGLVTARGVAMQIASLRAQYLTRDDVPADVVENERRIAEATAREEGKPEQALAKIVEGRVTGFFKEVVLLDQPYVRDNKKTVKAVL